MTFGRQQNVQHSMMHFHFFLLFEFLSEICVVIVIVIVVVFRLGLDWSGFVRFLTWFNLIAGNTPV